jgi:hypothetical protein
MYITRGWEKSAKFNVVKQREVTRQGSNIQNAL